jgi:hypothetical protein
LIECTEDLWQYSGSGPAVIAITTNGSVAMNGKAIIGRGVAGDKTRNGILRTFRVFV